MLMLDSVITLFYYKRKTQYYKLKLNYLNLDYFLVLIISYEKALKQLYSYILICFSSLNSKYDNTYKIKILLQAKISFVFLLFI